MEEANKLIGTGKRHLVMGDALSAVNVLQDACGMLAKKYGDTADECGEAFFLCGKALLELARMENTVLGNALEGVPEENEEEEEEEKPKDSNIESTENVDEKSRDALRVQVYDAMAEEEEKKKSEKNGDSEKSTVKEEGDKEKQTGNSHVNGSDSSKGGEEEEKAKKKKKKENGVNTEVENREGTESSEKPEEEDGDDGEEEGDVEEDGTEEKDSDDDDDEEVGNLQLAWEMLEVAKVIYKRKESKEDQLLAAQAHLKLGEVATESGNYPQAVEDFQECLALQLKHLSSDSRLLAETHYQLGLTFCFTCQYCEAIEHLNNSCSVIKSRLAKLQEMIDKAEGPEGAEKEMEELNALLPEIQEKVEDAVEGQKMASVAETMASDSTSSSGFPASSAFPALSVQNGGTSASIIAVRSNGDASSKSVASDISHLVRKKRKPEESPVKESDTKKVKQESHVNSNRDPVRQMNGVKGDVEVKSQ